MVTKETKKQLTEKINQLFKVMFALLGIIIIIPISIKWYIILLSFYIGGLIGHLIRPYNKGGGYRY